MSSSDPTGPCCVNGHQQPVANSRFCIYCGAGMAGQPSGQPAGQPSLPPQSQATSAGPSPTVAQGPRTGSFPVQSPPAVAPVPAAGPVIAAANTRRHRIPGCCGTCGGDGSHLSAKQVMCPECRWLRPLAPGYQVDASAFAWAADAKAMATLRNIKALTATAAAVSERVGRRWIEVTFNGIRLGEKQMPQIFAQAVRAARVLGMSHMPDIYLSGERPWDMLTFGTDRDSFVVIGSALASNFQGPDMYFLLARQLGHCKAGHALWKTVIRFLLGDQGPQKGVMAGGIVNTLLSPTALISGAIEMPLLGWARQAEITADRAGLLAVGNEEVARRVLMSWSLKSSHLYQQLNMDAWIEQQSLEEDQTLRLSEMMTTSTPYLGPRLKLLHQYAHSPELQGYLKVIGDTIRRANAHANAQANSQTNVQAKQQQLPSAASTAAQPAAGGATSAAGRAGSPTNNINGTAAKNNENAVTVLRIKCTVCGTRMQVPKAALATADRIPVRCPNSDCGTIVLLEKRVPASPDHLTTGPTKQQLEILSHGD